MRYATLILLLLLGGLPVAAQDLRGIWVGQYKYAATDKDGANMFTLIMHAEGSVITGKILERNTFGHESWKQLSAELVGEVTGTTLKFYKKYDGSGLQNHVVVYEGTVAPGRIAGEWRIGGTSGPFELVKAEPTIFATKKAGEDTKF